MFRTFTAAPRGQRLRLLGVGSLGQVLARLGRGNSDALFARALIGVAPQRSPPHAVQNRAVQAEEEMLAAEREAFIAERDAGTITDEVLRAVLHGLDLEEAALNRN